MFVFPVGHAGQKVESLMVPGSDRTGSERTGKGELAFPQKQFCSSSPKDDLRGELI